MLLDEWLYRNGMKIKEFAEIVNMSPNYIGFISCGRMALSKKLAKLIEEKTNGEVTAKEMLEDWKQMRLKPKDRT